VTTPSLATGASTTRRPLRALDNARFEELCASYRPRIAAYVQKAFPHADTDEITQDTLRKAFRHHSHVLELPDPWPWLAVTARNTAINRARDDKARTGNGAELLTADVYATEPDGVSVEDQAVLREQVRLAFRAMEALTRDQRALIELMVREGLSVSEAGRRLGYAEATARQHLCRLRSRLRTRFAALGGTLATVPLGLIRVARRGSARTMTLPATVSLAAGTTLALTAVIGSGIALLPSGADATATTAYQTRSHATPAAHLLARAPRARRVRATSSLSVKPAERTALPVTPAAHVALAENPTAGGDTAAGDLVITTPVGIIHVEDVQQQTSPVCVAGAAGTCG
jgi:RNA polymerase sigma-70 factor (ECF subfamily)